MNWYVLFFVHFVIRRWCDLNVNDLMDRLLHDTLANISDNEESDKEERRKREVGPNFLSVC